MLEPMEKLDYLDIKNQFECLKIRCLNLSHTVLEQYEKQSYIDRDTDLFVLLALIDRRKSCENSSHDS